MRTVLVVLLAIVFGLSAAVGINSLKNQSSGDGGDQVSVLVATTDIPRGRTITSDLIKVREYPKDLAPEGALKSKEEALERTALVPLAKDEMVLDAKLAARTAGRGIAPLVPDGMRACTITANITSGVAGFILPGNRVDVLLTVTPTAMQFDPTGGGSTTTLLQNVEILAVDQHVEAPNDNKADPNLRSVTLLVSQNQATKLVLGQNKGVLQLTLRNPGDKKPANTQPATMAQIQFMQEKPWDEQLKGVLEAAAKVLAQRRAAPEPIKPVAHVQLKPPPGLIHTLRGKESGRVYIEAAQPPESGQ
jgi:pilus assembly protein CpaB